MSQKGLMIRIAQLVRKMTWIMAAAGKFIRLTRARFTVGAIGVVFDDHDNVLVVEHVFHPRMPWGLPGGWVEARENPAKSLEREFREELSLKIQVGPVVTVEHTYGSHINLAYLCYTSDTVGKLSFELLEYRWVQIDQLPDRMYQFHRRAIYQAQAIRRLEVSV